MEGAQCPFGSVVGAMIGQNAEKVKRVFFARRAAGGAAGRRESPLFFFPGFCYTCGVKGTRTALRSGQTMVEYVIVLAVLIGVVLALGTLSGALRSNEARTLDLVASWQLSPSDAPRIAHYRALPADSTSPSYIRALRESVTLLADDISAHLSPVLPSESGSGLLRQAG